METWWSSMDITLQIAWVIALTTSLIFVIQMIMTFIGMDANADFSGDMGEPSLSEVSSTLFSYLRLEISLIFLRIQLVLYCFSGMLENQF